MCLGWLYHHLWDLARAGTREAQCASWAQYDTALEQSPVCWTTIRDAMARPLLACCWVLELLIVLAASKLRQKWLKMALFSHLYSLLVLLFLHSSVGHRIFTVR